jgi:hypothetical protein
MPWRWYVVIAFALTDRNRSRWGGLPDQEARYVSFDGGPVGEYKVTVDGLAGRTSQEVMP